MLKDAFLQSLERPYKKHLKCILPKLLMKMNFFDVNVFSKMYKRQVKPVERIRIIMLYTKLFWYYYYIF